MRLDQIGSAARLATKLTSLKERRDTWAKVDLTNATVTRRLNGTASSEPRSLPMLDEDANMHSAIVAAIIGEYDKRITETESELTRLGVEVLL
jgi:hypothetical protein